MAFNYFAKQQEKVEKQVQVRTGEHDLSASEIELVIKLLMQTSFPVKEIETLYIALYKLQEQHKQRTNELQS